MDATAVPIADAGSNTQTQPSQLLLYLPRALYSKSEPRAAEHSSQARFGYKIIHHTGDLLLVLQVGEDRPRRRGCRADVPNTNAAISAAADHLRRVVQTHLDDFTARSHAQDALHSSSSQTRHRLSEKWPGNSIQSVAEK